MIFIKKDHIGERCGPYEIVGEENRNGTTYYIGKCIHCGTTTIQKIGSFHKLKNNICHHYDKFGFPNLSSFGKQAPDPELTQIFIKMKIRCYDKDASDYRFYGAKGIHICDEWLENPFAFFQWSLDNGYKKGLSIDRIDSSKDYSPENCRFLSSKLNSKHKSTTNYYTIPVTGREAAKIMGVGTNYVNTYAREHGHEETQKMIDTYMSTRILDKRS